MRNIRFLLIGVIFGIVMTKSEVVSWFRIQEMFRFDSFHMYGVIGVAVVVSALGILLLKRSQVKTVEGTQLKLKSYDLQWTRLLLGGSIFGLGWAMTGACPGPLYTLVGQGHLIIFVVIAAALLGALTYGALRAKLPH
jgi:uncharacterized membrane protein YedE/YeeE